MKRELFLGKRGLSLWRFWCQLPAFSLTVETLTIQWRRGERAVKPTENVCFPSASLIVSPRRTKREGAWHYVWFQALAVCTEWILPPHFITYPSESDANINVNIYRNRPQASKSTTSIQQRHVQPFACSLSFPLFYWTTVAFLLFSDFVCLSW